MMKSNADKEFVDFFDSIGLESWIEPLKNAGVSSLKFLYVNFLDIINDVDYGDMAINSLRQNRLHVKIILKRLKDKFESNVNTSIVDTPVESSNKQFSPQPSSSKKIKISSQNGWSTARNRQKFESKLTQATVMQASILNANIEGIYCEEKLTPKPDGSHEVFIKIFAPKPENPKKERFLDDWNQYATYQPILPQVIHDFMDKVNANIVPISQKEFDHMKETLSLALFQDLQHYFIWRLPPRFLYTVCDRLIQMYPMWDDGSPTKTETIKKRLLDKYMHFRRFKIPPDWVEHKYIMLKNGMKILLIECDDGDMFNDFHFKKLNLKDVDNCVLPNGGKKRGRIIQPKPPIVTTEENDTTVVIGQDNNNNNTSVDVLNRSSISNIIDSSQNASIGGGDVNVGDDDGGGSGDIIIQINDLQSIPSNVIIKTE
ncbi:hypothetical protein HUG17_3875 [Dermatophagoides farinae]|uniref:Uncharacterized protein n=1 Tax=Dermatophagoides farinae TaxID=6954 RepID=A0A9D4NX69_DERFA|nr:hypothetical protein HUG17_3875 [Dermatophagoides farinae]